MTRILLLSILFLSTPQEKPLNSPDGNFSVSVDNKELSDLQHRYRIHLTDNRSKKSIEIANCITRDLPQPNFYWDRHSRFLIFEQSNESFDKATIKIFNLKTRNIDVVLSGLIGNNDMEGQQYDSDNEIILYFKSTHTAQKQISQLCAYEIKSKKSRVLLNFDNDFEMDFPSIKRTVGKRALAVSYFDTYSGACTQLIKY